MSFELILPFLRPIEPMLLDENISEIMNNPDATGGGSLAFAPLRTIAKASR